MAVKKQKINPNLSDSNKSFHEQIDEIRSLVEENLRYTKSLHQSNKISPAQSQQQLPKLLQENLRISKDLQIMMRKVNHWIVWQRVWGLLKILIIVIPIILGAIYLPPLLKKISQPYQEIFQNFGIGQPVVPSGNADGINQLLNKVNSGEIEIQLPQ